MITIERVETWGFEHAVRGMRNPLNSWDRSDSYYTEDSFNCKMGTLGYTYVIGDNDKALMQKLFKAGTEHRKYLRQIFVSMDITAPLYWWKEFDTYKVGTTSNSCSTMHKIHAKEFEPIDFSIEHLTDESLACLNTILAFLNENRRNFIIGTQRLKVDSSLTEEERKNIVAQNKQTWWQMIQLLPSSYNQKRTITMTYENVMSMIHQRSNHKLDEWCEFVECLQQLPYIKEITNEENID